MVKDGLREIKRCYIINYHTHLYEATDTIYLDVKYMFSLMHSVYIS